MKVRVVGKSESEDGAKPISGERAGTQWLPTQPHLAWSTPVPNHLIFVIGRKANQLVLSGGVSNEPMLRNTQGHSLGARQQHIDNRSDPAAFQKVCMKECCRAARRRKSTRVPWLRQSTQRSFGLACQRSQTPSQSSAGPCSRKEAQRSILSSKGDTPRVLEIRLRK